MLTGVPPHALLYPFSMVCHIHAADLDFIPSAGELVGTCLGLEGIVHHNKALDRRRDEGVELDLWCHSQRCCDQQGKTERGAVETESPTNTSHRIHIFIS